MLKFFVAFMFFLQITSVRAGILPELTQKKNFLPADMSAGYKGIPEWDNKKNLLSNSGDTMLKAPANYPDSPSAASTSGSSSSSGNTSK
ncbi:unknown [Acetobacter sp. CAG:977]|nr:unknown [Acetobacter sp. CAG:977]